MKYNPTKGLFRKIKKEARKQAFLEAAEIAKQVRIDNNFEYHPAYACNRINFLLKMKADE